MQEKTRLQELCDKWSRISRRLYHWKTIDTTKDTIEEKVTLNVLYELDMYELVSIEYKIWDEVREWYII